MAVGASTPSQFGLGSVAVAVAATQALARLLAVLAVTHSMAAAAVAAAALVVWPETVGEVVMAGTG